MTSTAGPPLSGLRSLRPVLPILIGASLMFAMSMGLRQRLGVFMPALIRDVGISVSQFTLAVAVQNLAWGVLQPLAGAWAVRIGFRTLMVAGRVDALPVPPSPGGADQASARVVALRAMKRPPFAVMWLAYFVCGMQRMFLTTHLPSCLDICGLDPMLSAQALGVIGGFNVLGCLFFGWTGGRYNKLLLGGICVLRSLGLAWYFLSVATPTHTLVFAAIMGFL